jgi:hypothetical protein
MVHALSRWAAALGWFRRTYEASAAAPGQNFGAGAPGRASIAHTVIRACTRCSAPGVFRSEDRIREGWSGCYVAPGDVRENKPVGAHCPNCGAPRGRELIEDRGVVWRGRAF